MPVMGPEPLISDARYKFWILGLSNAVSAKGQGLLLPPPRSILSSPPANPNCMSGCAVSTKPAVIALYCAVPAVVSGAVDTARRFVPAVIVPINTGTLNTGTLQAVVW